MCTVLVINNYHKEFPLIIAANRDELRSRQSEPVQLLNEENLIVGGKDKKKGGTWLAVNKQSLFVAITNQGKDKNVKNAISRGAIVLEALKCKTIEELLSFVENINPAKFNEFNIIFGNQKSIFVGHSYILHSMIIREIPAGINVITSDMKFTGRSNQAAYAHAKFNNIEDMPWLEYYKKLKLFLANSQYGVKLVSKKNDDGRYTGKCTQSSSILAFNADGLSRYKYYDRMNKSKNKEESYHRYKDYIDIWRNNGSMSNAASQVSEEQDDDKSDDEHSDEENVRPSISSRYKDIKIPTYDGYSININNRTDRYRF